MAEAKTHARRSPSGAKKRKLCPGSVVLEEGRPDKPSRYAAEGTAAHELMELCLTEGKDAEAYVGRVLEADGFEFAVDMEMADAVNEFVSHVETFIDPAAGDVLLVEQQVPIGHLTGEKDATGTADVVGIVDGGKHLVVIDFKYGRGVRVEAETEHGRNEQLLYYAHGVLEALDLLHDFERATLGIVQPRLHHVASVELTIDELRACADHLRAIEQACDAAEADALLSDPLASGSWLADHLSPAEEACRFCKAKAICPALRGEVLDLVAGEEATPAEFADLTSFSLGPVADPDPGAQPRRNWLASAMAKIGLVEDWCKAVRAEVEAELFAGREVAGFKLVQGKRGNRAWRDEVEAAAAMKAARLKRDEMFKEKLVSPAEAEKTIGKAKPRVWKKLAALIAQSEGQPSVAPADDKRPALDLMAAAADFADLGVAPDDGSDLV